MRGSSALRSIVAAIVAVCACVFAAGALAAPSAIPQPTPPPGGGGGGSSGGGGGGGSSSGTTTRRPAGPVAVANGEAGAALLEATGERTKSPVSTTTTTTTTTDPTTTTEPPVTTAEVPVTTAEAPVTTQQAPVTTAEIAPPTTTESQPAPAASSGGDGSGPPSLPRDGIVVLVGVLLLGLVVALKAIKSRERRIGWALLGFCVVYLLALAGLVTGVAGAAPANPGGFAATAGDGEVLLTFDPPPAGLTLVVRRTSGTVPPASCASGTPVPVAAPDSGSQVDSPLANGAAVSYRACLVDGATSSSGATASATPVSGRDSTAPRAVGGFAARPLGGRVVLGWRNPSDRDYAATIVVRKLGSAPKSPTDGKVVYSGDRPSALDYPFSAVPVHYAVFAVDEDGNAAAAARATLPRFDPPLRTPLDRSSTTSPRPKFTWKAVTADHYNVQVYRADRCCVARDVVVNAYPVTASLTAPKPLARGTYVWYVFAHVKPGRAVTSYRALNRIGWRFTVR